MACAAALAGCVAPPKADRQPAAPPPALSAAETRAPADSPPPGVPPPIRSRSDSSAARRVLDVAMAPLYVQAPRAALAQIETIWAHLREDALDAQTTLRLRQNGLRVGVGQLQWWDGLKAQLDAAPGVRSMQPERVRIPPRHPLALELDDGPHDQTLFFVGPDGVLSGETWPQSRTVLRLSYELNLDEPNEVRLLLTPEVRQRTGGIRYARTQDGVTQTLEANGRAFSAAAFAVGLRAGEFLVVAPSAEADLYGLVGGALLVREQDGERYDCYVFLRADVNYVAQRN